MRGVKELLNVRPIRRLMPLAWMVLIFVVSAQPTLPTPPDRVLDLLLKKTAHMLEYGVLFWLWWRVWDAPRPPRAWWWAWVLSVLYAATDEFHQAFVPGRHGRITDVLIDAAGVTLAAALAWLTVGRRGG